MKQFCALIFSILVALQTLSGQISQEILGRPTDHSVTLRVLFTQSVSLYAEWGTTRGTYTSASSTVNVDSGVPAEILFDDLNADSRYYYRIRYKTSGATSFLPGIEHTFHTQRTPGARYRFTVESDVHQYDKKGCVNLWDITLQNQLKDTADFMFDMGDTFGDDHQASTITSDQVKKLHLACVPHFAKACHSVPLFFCLGNHEGEFDYYLAQTPPENLAIYGTTWRKYYFPNPYPDDFYSGNTEMEAYGVGHPENYYSFQWGNALFVVLDVYRYQCDTSAKPKNWEWSIGFAQYSWLKNTLEQSSAKFKVVFAHHVRGQGRGGASNARFFEWGGLDANGTTDAFDTYRPGWGKPIHKLFVDNGVNIFFQGHDHLFAHEVLDGIVYQEVPMPSDSTYEIGMLANADAYYSDTLDGSGHLRVTVSAECMKVDYVRAYLPADTLSGNHKNREVAFTYTIGTCTSQSTRNDFPEPPVKVFPNPASSQVTIECSKVFENPAVKLLNLMGNQVLTSKSKIINVSKIPDGAYLLSIKIDQTVYRERLIILH